MAGTSKKKRTPPIWKRHPTAFRFFLVTTILLVAFGGGLVYSMWVLVCAGDRCPSVQALDDYTPKPVTMESLEGALARAWVATGAAEQ